MFPLAIQRVLAKLLRILSGVYVTRRPGKKIDEPITRETKLHFHCSADHGQQDLQPYLVIAQSAESDDHSHT